MATTPSGPTLTCSQCGFANEAERVYCHNCGAKLDRSLLPKAEEASKESIDKTRKRVQKMTNPSGLNAVHELKTGANVIAWSALIALIVGFIREPDGLPPAKTDDLTLRMIGSELSEAVESPQPRTLIVTEAEANSFLRTSLKSKGTGWIPGAKFERAFVKFEKEHVYAGLEQSLFGFSLHSGARYRVGMKDGKFFASNVGGNFGRVAIHPFLMNYASAAFQPLWKTLKRERDQVQGMQNVVVEKERIGFVTKGRVR